MFVAVARVVLQIPESGSLKAKRQVLRRVTDRLKARFNVAVAEVDDNDLWQRATLGLAVVGNDRRHVDEQMQKVLHAVEEMYVAPVIDRQMETLGMGDQLFSTAQVRSLADAEADAAEAAEREVEEAALRRAEAGGAGEEGEEEGEAEPAGLDLAGGFDLAAHLARGDRSMAEAEGMGEWEARHARARSGAGRAGGGTGRGGAGAPASGGGGTLPSAAAGRGSSVSGGGSEGRTGSGGLTLEQARARARALRNPREWEKP